MLEATNRLTVIAVVVVETRSVIRIYVEVSSVIAID